MRAPVLESIGVRFRIHNLLFVGSVKLVVALFMK